ncbi:MAG: hypothetical protein IPL52_06805 [Flavobacteriales bacterium]|nr:hypothetical protein [Flavobacteriales bacterium]
MKLRYAVLSSFIAVGSGAFAQAINDECATAIPIACGETATGSTANALADEALTCGTTITAPGVWYVLQGTGAQVTVTTCPNNGYDTKLNVYTGVCGNITCVAGNDDIAAGVYCSNVGFAAQAGATYYILVQGYNGAVGAFELNVTCVALTPDVCEGGLPIQCGETASSTTDGASVDTAPACGTDITAPGVWYTLEGVDAQITVTTCPDNTYDTKLNVYSGDCGDLQCVGGNDDIAGGVFCSSFTFSASAGTTYHILVQGYDGEVGDFDLAVTCVTCGIPQNVSVAPIDVSAILNWSSANPGPQYTIEYGPAGFTPGSGTIITGTYGVNGPPVTLSGLTISTNYELYIQEDCGGGDISPVAGPIAFTTLAAPPAANALCPGALPITCGDSATGNTQLGSVTLAPTCGAANVTTKGLWYSFTGTGDDVTLSTCSGTTFDSKISVFTGTCNALACIAGSDDAPNCPGNTSSATFHTLTSTTYYVMVHGYDQSQGDFTLAMTCATPCVPVDNDDCGVATLLTLQSSGGCEASTGTTECAFATGAPAPPCDPYGNIVDTWYAFNSSWAENLTLILEAVDAATINAAVYTACNAPAYVQCWTDVASPIDLSGLAPNTDYLLRIWNGGLTDAGTYTVCLEGDFNLGLNAASQPSSIALYPVPAMETLTVQGVEAVSVLTAFDVQGREVLRQANNGAATARLRIASLSPGIYLLVGDGHSLGRFVKE